MTYTHTQLYLVKGLQTIPFSNNQSTLGLGVETLSLLDANGFSIEDVDGYVLQRPSLKNGGSWMDGQLLPGRSLIAAQPANVTETIQGTINAGNLETLSILQERLERFAKDVQDYWAQDYQIAPCYIANQVQGEPRKRYALIMNMEIQYEDLDSESYLRGFTISIEREPYWRDSVAPGSSPTLWAFMVNQNAPYANPPDLLSTGSLAYKTVLNRSEFDNASYTALKSENFVDIEAEDIPGDAPALCAVSIDQSATGINSGFVGLKSVFPDRLPTNISAQPVFTNTRNAPDATLGTNATLANDTGGVRSRTSTTAQRGEVSFAAGTAAAVRFTWAAPAFMNQLIGRWAVFLRCRQVNGTFGQITMYMSIGANGQTSTTGGVILPTTSPQLIGTTGNTSNWGVAYMGSIAFPIQNTKASMQSSGTGLNTGGDLEIALVAARSAGTGLLYIADVVLIPLDEGGGEWKNLGTLAGGEFVIDNSGFSTHGNLELYQGISINGAMNSRLTTYLGSQILLRPRTKNRLYFLFGNPSDPDDTTQSQTGSEVVVAVNIIPRWVGVVHG